MGNTITSLINWFKPKDQKPKNPSNNNPLPPLPNDVLASILAKLDAVSLCRCTAASNTVFAGILPLIPSLSTTLPSSFFLPERATLWYGKLFYYLLRKSEHYVLLPLLNWVSSPLCCFAILLPISSFFLWIHSPRVSPSGRRFFCRLKGLKSVQLELPTPSSADYLTNPNSWFRWDAEFKADGNCHFLLVIGEKQDNDENELNNESTISPNEELIRKFGVVIRHIMLHLFTIIYLQFSGIFEYASFLLLGEDKMKWFRRDDSWSTEIYDKNRYMSRDATKNGRVMVAGNVEDSTNDDASELRAMVCYVPTAITVTNGSMKNGSDSVRIKNVWIFLVAFDDDANRSTEDFLRTCVGEFEQGVDDDDDAIARKEIAEVVTKILVNGNRRDWNDPNFWLPY
ncbi:hypothetical protein SOVF_097400 [Spinacia oleracea]|nr:hypothetical protein SOVF_097400 [Spinacia oleracea]